MAEKDKRKQSLYFPEDMLGEIQAEAVRLDRSMSWMMQQAWTVARAAIARFPTHDSKTGTPSGNAEPLPRQKVELPDPYLHQWAREREEKASKK